MSDESLQARYAKSGRPLIIAPDEDAQRLVARAVVGPWVALLTLYVDEDGDLVQSIDVYIRDGDRLVLEGSGASTLDDLRRPGADEPELELGLEILIQHGQHGAIMVRSIRLPLTVTSDDSLEGFALAVSRFDHSTMAEASRRRDHRNDGGFDWVCTSIETYL